MITRPFGLVLVAVVAAGLVGARDAGSGAGARALQELSEKGIRHYAEFTVVEDRPLKVLVRNDGGEDRLMVFDAAKGTLLVEDSGQTERFLDVQVIQSERKSAPMVVTRWTKGAHGHQVRIYDGMAMVFQKASAWPIEIENEKGRLRIRVDQKWRRTGKSLAPLK